MQASVPILSIPWYSAIPAAFRKVTALAFLAIFAVPAFVRRIPWTASVLSAWTVHVPSPVVARGRPASIGSPAMQVSVGRPGRFPGG